MKGKHILTGVLLLFLIISPGAPAQDEPASAAGASAQKKPINVLLYFGLYTQWYRIDKALEPLRPHALRTVNAKSDGADFIPGEKDISAVDVVVLSNVNHGSIKDSGLSAIDSFVKKGGGLLVLGGPLTYGEGKFGDSIFPQMLPIEKPERFDLKWEKAGLPFSTATEHEILKDVDLSANPRVYWIHEARPKSESVVVLKAGSRPLLVLAAHGKGRVAAFLGTPMGMAPAGQLPFWEWKDWEKLIRNTIVWLGSAVGERAEAANRIDPAKCPDGMTGYWTFDESWYPGKDNLYGNAATVSGATFTTGKVGGALDFDGVDDYVRLPANADTSLENDASTLLVWMNIRSFGPNGYASAYSSGTGATLQGSVNINIRAEGLSVDIGNGSGIDAYHFPAAVKFNRWYHFAVIINHNDNTIKAYINGSLLDTLAFTAFAPDNPSPRLGSNQLTGNPGDCFDGIMDEVAIYNRALSNEEILRHYELTSNGNHYCERK